MERLGDAYIEGLRQRYRMCYVPVCRCVYVWKDEGLGLVSDMACFSSESAGVCVWMTRG